MNNLELSITFTPPPADAGVLATWEVLYKSQRTTGTLPIGLIDDKEQATLQWYLEEYIDWPFDMFATRGKEAEQLLSKIGQRLYKAVFEADVQVTKIFGQWNGAKGNQLTIISELPTVLNLPWELLHDGQGFLNQRRVNPVAITRSVSNLSGSDEQQEFEPPLRVLLVVARPDDTGFLDPRSSARAVFEELERLEGKGELPGGMIELEFLRPPTLQALSERLSDAKRPVHVLHFDGHGVFPSQKAPAPPSAKHTIVKAWPSKKKPTTQRA